MDLRYLSTSMRGPALLVRFDRPDKANALSTELLGELVSVLDDAEQDTAVRGVVLTGGERLFSAGADLREVVADRDMVATLRYMRFVQRVTRTVEQIGTPVIAAIRGHCLTGGLELALSCDLRLAGESAHFAITSSRIGSVAGMGGTQRLTRVVGASRAKDILLSGRDVAAAEAGEIGLVDGVHPDEEVLDRAVAWVAQVAQRAPLAVHLSKLAVNLGAGTDLDTALGIEGAFAALAAGTADRREGIRAFLDKRPAVFRGV